MIGFRLGYAAMLALALAGCASNADQIGPAFVDPARYTLYNCDQLATEYKTLVTRENELRELMDRAKQGAGGAVVAEVAYGSDYVTVHGRRQSVEERARQDNCDLSRPPRPAGRGVPAR